MFGDLYRDDPTLRDYQREAKEKIFGQWDCVNNVLYQMPTGTGKTRLFTSLIRDINLSGLQEHRRKSILIIAHRTELIEQIDASLNRYHIPHGIIAGSFKDRRDLFQPIQVASIQTITHPSNYQLAMAFDADFIIIDEAHHAIANSYAKLWDFYPNSKKLGVTATPWRMDGQSFKSIFDVMIPSMSIKNFLSQGWLAPYQYYSVPVCCDICNKIDSINEFGIDGDFKTSALEEIVDTGRIRAQLLDSYFQFVKGKKGIIYSISRVHSKHICQQYRDAGIKIADIDSQTPPQLRKRLVQEFKDGYLDVIVNVDIFSEGFDCPDLEFVQLARPTKSLVKYIQQVGRGLRKNGDKQCLILDNVGMYGRFGLPDDDRPWDLYFNGSAIVSNSGSKRDLDPKLNYTGFPREVDLSEGSGEMQLIQAIHLPKTRQDPVIDNDESSISDELDEIFSNKIFSKYRIVENLRGYFIENITTQARQKIRESIARKSISIKITKTNGASKSYTIISSFNRESKPSTNDRIIGYLFKDGSITRFKVANHENEIVINI